MRPRRSLLDPTFKYTPAASTDLRRTFARVRREQRRERVEQSGFATEAQVIDLKRRHQP